MSNSIDDYWRGGPLRGWVAEVVAGVRIDLARLHRVWMGLAFDHAHRDDYSVVEGWTPQTTGGTVRYRLWAALGVLPLLVVYPLSVLGLVVRFYARRLDRASASLGVAGIVLLSVVVWGVLTVATYASAIAFEGLVAVAIAGGVATVSAVLALLATRRPGRGWTLLAGYPLGVTAIFLPPVVASLYSPTLAAVVFPHSTSLAALLLDTVLQVGGIAEFIRASFELEGVAYVGMWFGLAVPVGWLLGGLVTLADAVRSSRPAVDPATYHRG